MCWIDTYLEPPNQIATNVGKNFISKEFSQLTNTIGIRIKVILVESYNSISLIE